MDFKTRLAKWYSVSINLASCMTILPKFLIVSLYICLPYTTLQFSEREKANGLFNPLMIYWIFS